MLCASILLLLLPLFFSCTGTTINNLVGHYRYIPQVLNRKKSGHDQVLLISVPKSGTHLFLKCITALHIKRLWYDYTLEVKPSKRFHDYIESMNQKPPPNHYKGIFYPETEGPYPKSLVKRMNKNHSSKLFWTHWTFTQEFNNYLQKKTYANFLMIRDPRDMVVSFAHMIHKGPAGHVANVEKIILDLITAKKEYFLRWAVEIHQTYPLLWEIGLYKFYTMYLPWGKAKNFMVVKFEDLIGKNGGGSTKRQMQTIQKMGAHLGFIITPTQAEQIIDNLFGGTWTFREGKIGGWRQHFTPEIKAAFKADHNLMKLLIDLGYETGNEW